MTKPLARILFHKHVDRIMGRIVPKNYRQNVNEIITSESNIHTLQNSVYALNVENITSMGGVL